jgi:hypothetical protein
MQSDLSESWVTGKLACGLGNRLFQLANAYTMAKQWNRPLVFAMPYCLPSEHGDYDTIFKMFPNIPKIWKAEADICFEQETVFKYILLPQDPPGSRILLKGFWQAAAYVSDSFEPSWDAIADRSGLLARWNLTTHDQKKKTAFLHVRLGDYQILPHYQVNLLAYFATCIEKFPEDTRFLVFSDTPEVARTLPVFNDRCVFVDETDEYKALFLMSQCWAGSITANSTFSWWGAFFGRQASPDQASYKSYMPGKWFVEYMESTEPIYPQWTTVVPIV